MHRINKDVRDILFGIVVPTVVAFIIIGVGRNAALSGILSEAIVIVAVPMLIGLIWNQWAGGAAGFLLGSMYALWYSDILYAAQGKNDFSVLGNLVSAMLIGYVAGALNKRSTSYRRLLTAGVIAGIMGSLIIIAANFYSPIMGAPSVGASLLTLLPRVLSGLIVPFVAKAFLAHGTNKQIH